jgi:hypothetical protein
VVEEGRAGEAAELQPSLNAARGLKALRLEEVPPQPAPQQNRQDARCMS